MRDILDDATYAFRMMAGRPGFTILVVLTLALGIGATTAMFGTVQAALLSRLPYGEPERLVMGRATFDGEVNPSVSGYDYYDYRDRSASFESLAAFMVGGRSNVLGATEPERVETGFATWDLFETLGVTPARGRFFLPEEGVAGAADVVVISDRYWQHRFGGAPEAVGSTLVINGAPFAVVGILPPGFHFMERVDLWRLTYRDGPGADARRWHNLLLVGRLKPGVTVQEAQSEVDVISRNLQVEYPGTNEGKALLLTPLKDALVENVRASLLLLMAAVSMILLLACVNVAGLLLSRGQARRGEIAIRTAVGASRGRLVRQLLTESALLALLGGAAGLAVAAGCQRLLLGLLPMGRIGITEPRLDGATFAFAAVVSLGSGILFGLVPALRGTDRRLSGRLESGARTTGGSSLLRGGLVVLQVALSVTLLIGAGLMMKSLARQMNVELGFDPTNVLTAGVTLPESDYETPEQRVAFFESLVERVEALPGVVAVGLVNRLPIRDRSGNIYLYPADAPPETSQVADMSRTADFRYALPGYLETIGIPLLAGRDIETSDVEGATRVMIVSQSLAELFFPGRDPIGQRLVVDMGEMVVHEIVGVAGDARLNRVTSEPRHAMYMSYYQVPRNAMRIAIKCDGAPQAFVRPLREILRAQDRNIPLAEPATMEMILDDAIADYRIVTSSLGLFSAVSLLLAMTGLYGVLSFYVGQRGREMGLRIALGAAPRQVTALVLVRGMWLVAVGLATGLMGAYAASRAVRQLLFGVEPTDAATFLAVGVFCAFIAFVACWLPARRASRVDPVETLQAS